MRLNGSFVASLGVALFAYSFPVAAQSSKPKTPPKKPGATKPAARPLPALPQVEWPFPKATDSGITTGYNIRTLGMMQDNSIFVEPVLMKGEKVVYQYGCGLMIKGKTFGFGNDIDIKQIQVGGGFKDGKLLLTLAPEFAESVRPRPADYKGSDPFYDFNRGFTFDRLPTVYGIAVSQQNNPFSIAYDLRTFTGTLLQSDNKNAIEYGMAYLACCNFPKDPKDTQGLGPRVINPSELNKVIVDTPLQYDRNDNSIFQQSMERRVTGLIGLLNRSMQQWASRGQHLYKIYGPKDDLVPGNPRTLVFSQLILPIQEFQLAKDYEANANNMIGPERLKLRMTSNRVLLDRILVSPWAAIPIPRGQQVPEGQEQRMFRSNELSKWAVWLTNEYGAIALGFADAGRNLEMFNVGVLPTPLANQTMEKLELTEQPKP